MKNVYFIQANNVYGTERKSTYLPYAAGCIQAYCLHNPVISSNYCFQKIIYSRVPIPTLVRSLEVPYIVLFSCSVWNAEYNKKAAAAIKEAYPACFIVFGGHSVSADGAFLAQYPFIDFLTHRFGEEPTEGILVELAGAGAFGQVPNISYRAADGTIITTAYAPQTGTDYPSPYIDGIFDEILQDDVDFSALFETNRGCPNACAFCDWGSLKSKVRLFPMERVLAEIDWFVAHRFEFVYCTDGNFCLFSRDEQIADYVIAAKKKYGYPKIFRVCFTKNRLDFVFRIGSRFVENGLDKAQTLSFQSMNPTVLENIGRKNIPTETFRNLMTMYHKMNISTFSELILGLPGETYDSFCKGVGIMLESGQHFAINIYPCELLPNAQMGQKAYKERFGIRSTRVPFQLIHSNERQNADDITEYSEYITSTDTMREEEWARALLFSDYIQGLHNLGLLRAVAIWCRQEYQMPYECFYNRLIEWSAGVPEETLLHRVYTRVWDLCTGIIAGTNALVAKCEGLDDVLWGFDELIFLEFYKELDRFYAEIGAFLEAQFGQDEMQAPLLQYQQAIIKKIGEPQVEIVSPYDFYSYYQRIYLNEYAPLEHRPIRLQIEDPDRVDSFAALAKYTVWYGRNRRETDYTSSHYQVDFEEIKY